ncbi:hypothetical protein [Albimonas pacifica]|uniref:Uncharacterized protein n=1 Tax=Albimonas pacifica TaxID=1114924 RepID=A0A1I3K1B3_9RHOB|nr:hypothetical protein [Albimonas pacifica]SFI66243.1 hypothetical protein SAMN05216258_108252 [Albimonas pacifica]
MIGFPAAGLAAAAPLAARNALLDCAFYDVEGLSGAERALLAPAPRAGGAVVVVRPNPGARGVALTRHEDFAAFRMAPGDLLKHFALAGMGGSALGGAALARTLANHLDAPVGAIVGGCGLERIIDEALGGWVWFGLAGRARAWRRTQARPDAAAPALAMTAGGPAEIHPPPGAFDLAALLKVMRDPAREIRTLVGHSRGALTLAAALQGLWRHDAEAFDRLRHASVRTLGAVAPLPASLTDVAQHLGDLDLLGWLNSIPGTPRRRAPRAAHHLNPRIPGHLDFRAVLEGRI